MDRTPFLEPGHPMLVARAHDQWFRTVQETLCFHIWAWSRSTDHPGLEARMPLTSLVKAVKRQFPRKMVLVNVAQMSQQNILIAGSFSGEIRLRLTEDAFALETDRSAYLLRTRMDGEA